SFSGILGTKNAIASTKYSTTGLSAEDKADIADIGYGVSVIGIEKMFSDSKGYTTAVENLVNGHWGSSLMACFEFDGNHYNIKGELDENSDYTGLITLNFGSKHKFDAIGFSSGSLKGFPGVAEVYVSDDGVNWTLVPTACWDNVNGKTLVSCGETPADPWNGNTGKVTCLFDMDGVSGQYVRIGIIIGRNDEEVKYNTINTREILVYGEKLS
ncbi:MAG: discoidin domain-containing protein, partial [Eubacteriales bacterium]